LHQNRHDWSASLANKFTSDNFILAEASAERIALELCPSPILFASLQDLSVDWANAAAQRFLQLDSKELLGRTLSNFVPERELPGLWQTMADFQQGQQILATSSLSAEDGTGLCQVTLAKTNKQIIVVGESSLLGNDNENTIGTDALTGLPDRRVLQTRVEAALKREQNNWGLLFIDLNRYKQINDQYGHVAGDRVLVEFARKLQASSRPNDLVVRYGGDEFVVLVDRVPSESELRTMASRVAREVSVMVNETNRTIVITGSVGCAMASSTYKTVDQIVAVADRDMYARKRHLAKQK